MMWHYFTVISIKFEEAGSANNYKSD